jgi:squalene-hopene/tetraprenyl-beta-curcumene cyclase
MRPLSPAVLWHGLGWWLPVAAAGACFVGCGKRTEQVNEPETPPLVRRIDRSIMAAAKFLLDRQGGDGAWRSDTYGAFKDGGSLTPWVLHTLSSLPPVRRFGPAYRKGSKYLAAMVRPDGTINAGKFGLSYPVYTAAGAVLVLSHPRNDRHRKARDGWLRYLRKRQLTEKLGWKPLDREYGGWGYSIRLPRKPRKDPLTESNISATVFALEALKAAGVPQRNPAFTKALMFVKRCQNYSADPKRRKPAFDDGGFFFIYDDPDRNKAGVAGTDAQGRERYYSYGSTSADGLRCLLLCNLSRSHPRVRAARRWLERNFSAKRVPGTFRPDHENRRPAVYYYYVWSAAQALLAASNPTISTRRGKVRWAEALAGELLKRQGKEGSWVNPADFVREDDPIAATCMAASALRVCQQVIADWLNRR